MFQDYALFPHLTVEQNILFGLKRRPKPEAAARTEDVIAHIGIAHLKGRYPHMLSGGEQQRVALARALAPQPDILLMDEPFSNLDRGLREKVRDETLFLLKSLGTTVIMVTHDPEEALSAGDRVVLMKDGRIVQAGSGYDLHDRPVSPYAAEFFCAFNRISGVYTNGQIETAIGRFGQMLDGRDGMPATVYIRPQGISVAPGSGHAFGAGEKPHIPRRSRATRNRRRWSRPGIASPHHAPLGRRRRKRSTCRFCPIAGWWFSNA